MRPITKVFIALLLTLPTLAQASPFNPKHVPADAKWLLHIDVDAARASKTWEIIASKLQANEQYQSKINELQNTLNLRFPDDFHDITLFGPSSDEKSAICVIHANADRTRILNLLQLNPAYGEQGYGKYTVYTWQDKGKTLFGTFYTPDTVVMGQSRENLQAALDVMDAKQPSIKADNIMAGGAEPGVIAYVASDSLPELQKDKPARSPIIAQMSQAWISLSEDPQNLVLKATVLAKSPEAAQQMCKSIEGIKALVTLGAGENAPPKARLAADAMTSLTAQATESTVTIAWPVPIDNLRELSKLPARHELPKKE